jgi:ornithine lipid hydroxylase
MSGALRWAIFPLIVAGSAAGMAAAMATGAPVFLASAAGGLLLAAIVTALERALPFADDWRRSHGDLPADLAHLAVNLILLETLPARLLPDGSLAIWPADWPLAAQLVLALVCGDLLAYGLHRLLHGPLWRFHAVHHGAPRLYWINSWRLHPVEVLAYFLVTAVPFRLLGAPIEVLAVQVALGTSFRMLQHSNIDVRLGPLNRIFAMAEVHRWHHARDGRHAHANFGNMLYVWDHIFGTATAPRSGDVTCVGLPDGQAIGAGYLAQLASPFRRRS